jgi:large subunit ribosomal protein L5
MSYSPRLLDQYREKMIPSMMEAFKYSNKMEVPKLTKISVNVGMGDSVQDPKKLEFAINELALITGQKPSITKAKKAISNFRLREGMNIGAKVTLRGQRMYEFLDRFINIVTPRIRDFRGLSKTFDGRGNYNIGITEQLVFPEVDIDKISKIYGMNINFVTTAKSDEEAMELLKMFGMPFKK